MYDSVKSVSHSTIAKIIQNRIFHCSTQYPTDFLNAYKAWLGCLAPSVFEVIRCATLPLVVSTLKETA